MKIYSKRMRIGKQGNT